MPLFWTSDRPAAQVALPGFRGCSRAWEYTSSMSDPFIIASRITVVVVYARVDHVPYVLRYVSAAGRHMVAVPDEGWCRFRCGLPNYRSSGQ